MVSLRPMSMAKSECDHHAIPVCSQTAFCRKCGVTGWYIQTTSGVYFSTSTMTAHQRLLQVVKNLTTITNATV